MSSPCFFLDLALGSSASSPSLIQQAGFEYCSNEPVWNSADSEQLWLRARYLRAQRR
ncbi:hypothetical protein PF005_g4678 [Phytophthora fragariae]|uniref:Uncharacterized protein n=1 Tax=Phytophthora fragariae TaxID=53985 RepID=A0A6A3ERW8_9STRA|nr:hypothetical protein PF003_g14477 [Phytophthora fragariae]KAE8936272.1 hypothetical protein PF009_g13805 [Phytophthora fragariae]KAE9108628.1 hypothetical protein PF007_g12584 [Phytophthora fragariae]KAE9143438.1 hypothetical protein PF006_g11530 [Phytophthora fragariae]KAE9226695.1 hypothetical protein PF002_g14035 [Phytophthora fragariae]